MKKIFRILSIRKHKKFVFANTYTSDGVRQQVVFDKKMFLEKSFKKGDCISASCSLSQNNHKEEILKINRVFWISKCFEWDEAKNLPKKSQNHERYTQSNARNAGRQINVYKLKQELIQKITSLLEKDGFENTPCKVLEPERTASAIPPFQTQERYSERPFYLRITPENQLKQTAAILLKSVYSLDNVFYNKNPDARHVPEMCTLEFVSLTYSKQKLLCFITKTSRIMDNLSKKYQFETDIPAIPEIINYNDLPKMGITYQRRIPEFQNTILVNVPVDNPFIAPDKNGLRTETRWYLKGNLTAHGYIDETNYEKVTEALQIQKRHNNLDNVNEMPYFKWGLPKTISFGLGIDAMICRYLNLERMSMASNPLGINYVIPDKKRKQENQEDNLLISHQSNNDRNAAIHAILWNLREKKSEK